MPLDSRRYLILLRHAQTDWNQQLRFQGQTDVPLNQNGHQQTLLLKEKLKTQQHLFDFNQTAVISSDLSRAYQTAHILFGTHHPQIYQEPQLRECRYGVFEGLLRSEIMEKYPDAYREWQKPRLDYALEGGEKRIAVRVRALQALDKWLHSLPHTYLIFVTHGGVMRQILSHVFSDHHPHLNRLNFGNLCSHTILVKNNLWQYFYEGTVDNKENE